MGGSVAVDLAALAERARRGVAAVRAGAGGGTGTIWREDGLLVTAAHVVRGPRADVTLHDGRTMTAPVVARDARRDLALLALPVRGLAPLPRRDAGSLRIGELLVAAGHPLGVADAIAAGIGAGPLAGRPRFLRSDVRLAPGNSGGPLVDARGRLVGIAAMVAWGFGLAIPAEDAAAFVARALREGTRDAA